MTASHTIADLPASMIGTMTEAYLSNVKTVLTDQLQEDGLARIIADNMRDCFQLDLQEMISNEETDLGRIFELMEYDPWTNDERVAWNGFRRIYDLLIDMEAEERIRRLSDHRHYLSTVILPRMAAHPTHGWLQLVGIDIIYHGLPIDDGGQAVDLSNVVPPGDLFGAWAFGAWEWDNLFGVLPDTVDIIVRAMTVVEYKDNCHIFDSEAIAVLWNLLNNAGQRRAEIVERLVQAPAGKNQGIAALFRALETVAGTHQVVDILDILGFIDEHAPAALLQYAVTHPGWRTIIEDTHPDDRPQQGGLLGVPFAAF